MGKFQNNQTNQKQRKRIMSWIALFAVVCLLAAMPMLASGSGGDSGDQASILSASAGLQNVNTQIIGGGQLASEASIRVKLPEEVKITQYLVGNGDTVSKGDTIATVDKVSVMTAITEVQETLDYLSKQIANTSGKTASDTVKALAGGTVKEIYAKKGESVQDVMLEHGALAVLSLDDTMAVKLEVDCRVRPGDTVSVMLTNIEEVDGRVKSYQNGVLIVTIEDEDYAVGTQVTVKTEDGQRLGAGELYVFSPWNATAYSGTVSDILVEVGDTVYVGRTLMKLSDPGNSVEFQQLIDQRHEYEELMLELFQMYRTETITAPCDGIITGVDQDGTFLLADTGGSWVMRLLSFFVGDTKEGFAAYTAKVVSVSDNGMELLMNPREVSVSDLAELSHIPADLSGMTEVWHYAGDQTVYIQTADGLLQPAGTARAGDVLLAVGDSENVYWFVVLTGSDSPGMVQTSNPGNPITARLLSDVDTTADTQTENTDQTEISAQPDNAAPSDLPIETSIDDENQRTETAEAEQREQVESPMQPYSEEPTGSDSPVAADHDDENQNSGDWISPPVIDNPGLGDGGNENPCTGGADCTADTHNPGCLSQQSPPSQGNAITIITAALNSGVVGQSYSSPLQASDGTDILSGTWAASGLPSGLAIDPASGVISGTPETAGSYAVTVSFTYEERPVTKDFTLVIIEAAAQSVYRGYVAQVVEAVDGAVRVMQTAYSYTIADLNSLPTVSVDTSAMTVEQTYVSDKISSAELAAGDIVLVVLDESGTLVWIAKAGDAPGGPANPGMGGDMPSGGGSMPSIGSGMSGGMGQAQAQTFELYSLDKVTIASVTSQEHMTLNVTVDELDITKIYVGQPATVTMDALAGERFAATVSQISNSGTNEGGNSKFTVELTLEKSGDMLPGMRASAFITLGTAENVLCVPVAALGEENGETVLYTGYDSKNGTLTSPIPVSTGVADAEYVQILDGLSEGDTVYYAYYDTLPMVTPFG